MRYVIGTIVCLIGSLFIVLNEKKGKNDAGSESGVKNVEEEKYGGFSFGTIFGLIMAFIDIFFVSTVELANKVLVNNRIPIHTQVFYVVINTIFFNLFIIYS